jgi:hypothetical protein
MCIVILCAADLAYFLGLMMEAVRSTETSINIHQTIGRNIPEYDVVLSHCRENFKFLKIKFLFMS